MRKIIFNIFITLVGVAILAFLFYLGYMDSKGTPVSFGDLIPEWLM